MTPQLLASLARMLSSDPLTVEDVAAQVGPAIDDPGAPLPIVFRPTLSGVTDVRLWRDPDSGLPYLLKVEPSIDGRPTLADLEREFGTSVAARTDRGRPDERVFTRIARGTRWTVTAIAEIEASAASPAASRITSIKLRRDPTG